MTPPRLDPLSVQAKLALMAELVEDLDAVGAVGGGRLLEDRLLRRAVERMLMQVVDRAASVCSHVVSSRGTSPPTSYRGAFDAASTLGLVDEQLAWSFRQAVGMRNLLVHESVRADLELVAAAVPRARADAAAFVQQVSSWLLQQT
ncbi:type VII toxin-antitoxin system HepT family RNase toxin [Quadrisphaera sp. KR29]|uniref:type VII toxin-antitoxin system HepT family RNase toxin n=1 Tax=Quadrisphaera sp. KR29 TaxID=3461391 RepID=UPI004043C57A